LDAYAGWIKESFLIVLNNDDTPMHFIGIGAPAMAALAQLALSKGLTVSGSNSELNSACMDLKVRGATLCIGKPSNTLPSGDIRVIRSKATTPDHPEMVAAVARKLIVWDKAQLLNAFSQHYLTITAFGHACNTTTNALIYHMLKYLDEDPSYCLARPHPGSSQIAGWGKGTTFVFEADHTDSTFLSYAPDIAVSTHFLFDLSDQPHHMATTEDDFISFLSRVSPDGFVIVNWDQHRMRELTEPFSLNRLSFGKSIGAEVRWLPKVNDDHDHQFHCIVGRKMLTVPLPAPGEFYIYHALASLAVAQ
jgi:UDP-N-acetylmuramate--alanine ligase